MRETAEVRDFSIFLERTNVFWAHRESECPILSTSRSASVMHLERFSDSEEERAVGTRRPQRRRRTRVVRNINVIIKARRLSGGWRRCGKKSIRDCRGLRRYWKSTRTYYSEDHPGLLYRMEDWSSCLPRPKISTLVPERPVYFSQWLLNILETATRTVIFQDYHLVPLRNAKSRKLAQLQHQT